VTSSDDDAVREFVARHARPYDPEADAYDRAPFASDIKEGKNDPLYGAHSYHTKVPPRAIIPYILHYTEPGDVILDPFCGSGMTGVAALLCARPPADILEAFPHFRERVGPRHVILNDLSPAAAHIAYNYTTPVDIGVFRKEFERIKSAVESEFVWLYGTEHYEPAVALYDPREPGVAGHLKNPPPAAPANLFQGGTVRTWELVSRKDVETKLGYPVSHLTRESHWNDIDVGTVDQWLVIPATIQYTIWSDIYRCEGFITVVEPTGRTSTRGKNAGKPVLRKTRVPRGCGAELLLWDLVVDPDREGIREDFSCPACGQVWKKQNLGISVRQEPVETVLRAEVLGKTAGAMRRIRVQRRTTTAEKLKIAELVFRRSCRGC